MSKIYPSQRVIVALIGVNLDPRPLERDLTEGRALLTRG